MIVHSKIYRGKVVHERLIPEVHRFTYPMTFFGFDLEELPRLHDNASLFGYNEARPLRLNDSDYLEGASVPIARQLDSFLPRAEKGERTFLISSPKYFGYAFNPVNFYLRMVGQRLVCAVAEVNNTFGDRHVYPLKELQAVNSHTWTASCPKDFHVSPFNDMTGEYRFTFRIDADEIFLGVDLYREGQCVMKTWIEGFAHCLTNEVMIRYAILHPFDTALNSMPRILWQAALLYYKKKLKVFQRPQPSSEQTVVDRDAPEGPRSVV